MIIRRTALILALSLLVSAACASAQLADRKVLTLEAAKKMAAAAIAEAKKNNWLMSVAVVDEGGSLMYFERIDMTQAGSTRIAIEKARSAVNFKRPTKVFEDAVAGGRNAILGLSGAVPLEGGIPILMDGRVLGAVGVSGGTAPQDGQVAKAGVDALGK
jgi:glc operon protein GlcG